jgi:hypothetical protein
MWKTVARGGNCLFGWILSFVAFEIILNNGQLQINTREGYKMHMGENGVYGGNMEIITRLISEIYKVSVSPLYPVAKLLNH